MKVKFDAENKYVRKNNNPSFQGFTPKKNAIGKRVYEFNYPYDSKKYDCYLEVCSVETDDYGNYYVVEGLEKEGFKSETAELTRIPKNMIEVTDEKTADQILKLLDKLEEHDDVQNVYANCDISDEIMQKIEG